MNEHSNQGPNAGPGARANSLEQRIREAAAHVEEDVRKMVGYLNDEVMPDVRRNSSRALRSAAEELERLAGRMEEVNRPGAQPSRGPDSPPPPPVK